MMAYCLNPNHERGSHKARVFRQVFGITRDNAMFLKSAILNNIDRFEVTAVTENKYGKIYSLPMKLTIFGKEGEVMTAWIVEKGTDFPRLTSCFVNN